MARRSLRPHLNQIRTWARQGRTDAWIAHQLEVDGPEIASFKAANDLAEIDPETTPDEEIDLRAEDDELIAAELEAAEAKRKEEAERLAAEEAERAAAEAAEAERRREAGESDSEEESVSEGGAKRRRRRGGRRRRRSNGNVLEGTFDHGDEGYGLWLDPAVQDLAVYAEHWAGNRQITVTVEADQIVIRRAGEEPSASEDEGASSED